MKTPLLSICIATYNRAEYIGKTLESIIPQLTEEVEIVVVDGASTDSTNSVLKHYMATCKQIRYIRLPSKGGIDQDYCKAVEYAHGQMCWLFSDDDLLRPDAIKTVLSESKKGYCLIVVNAQIMSRDLLKILENKRLRISKNETYDALKFEELFHRIIPYVSFIGCVVINRDLWLQRDKKQYLGTEFVHIGVIFQAPLPAQTLVIAEPYITIRYGNSQWSTRALEIWMFKWPSLIWSLKYISQKVRQKHQVNTYWLILKNIIVFRAGGGYSLKDYREWFASKKSSLWLRIGALFIALIPGVFINLIMQVYYKMIKKEAWMSIYFLENSKYNIFKRRKLSFLTSLF